MMTSIPGFRSTIDAPPGIPATVPVDNPTATPATLVEEPKLVRPGAPGVVEVVLKPKNAPEAAASAGALFLTGALVGGISDDDWRGAFIGGGLLTAIMAGFSALTRWKTIDQSARIALGAACVVGAGLSAGVYVQRYRRKGRR